jgi:hypothetical protein
MVRFGARNGIQRYQCKICKATRSDSRPNLLGDIDLLSAERIAYDGGAYKLAEVVSGNPTQIIQRVFTKRRCFGIYDFGLVPLAGFPI